MCLDLSNKDGLTPRDLSWVVIPARFYNKKVLALFFLILESKSIHFFFDIVVQV